MLNKLKQLLNARQQQQAKKEAARYTAAIENNCNYLDQLNNKFLGGNINANNN